MTYRTAFHLLTKGMGQSPWGTPPYQGKAMYLCAHFLYTGEYKTESYEYDDPQEKARRAMLSYECNKRIVEETLPTLGEDTKVELRKLYERCVAEGRRGRDPPPLKQLFC